MWDWVVSGKFQFKFYKDTFVYYLFLILLVLLGSLAHFWLPLRNITTRRIRIHRPSEKLVLPFPSLPFLPSRVLHIFMTCTYPRSV
jgi:hypothetical protein